MPSKGTRITDFDDGTVVNATSPEKAAHSSDDATRVSTPSLFAITGGGGQARELKVGEVLKDRFEIVDILGRGGMGVVYRALDRRKVEAQDRDPYVAIKALSEHWQQNERMIIALQREARKAQTLAHPNIATVYDFDREGGFCYITMEQLNGQPLDEFIAANPEGIPLKRAMSIIRGLSLALAYAHNKGIVHSDFKPGNVFLNTGDNPKVLDFGIARAAPVTGPLTASHTTRFDAAELGALTPSYAAVEMFLGAPPHPADDVYALAITTYQLLTGRHPFEHQPAPKARAEGMKPEVIRGLKRHQWQAIRRGLAFTREERIGHAAEFLRAFEGSRNTKLALAATVVLALTLGGYYAFVQVEERARTAPDVAFEALPAEIQTSLRTHLEEGDTLAGFGDFHNALGAYRAAYELHPRNPEATEKLIRLLEQFHEKNQARGDAETTTTFTATVVDVMAIDGFLGAHKRLKTLRSELENQG